MRKEESTKLKGNKKWHLVLITSPRTTADKFIPEIWSDEIVAAYKANLVAANLVL